MVSSRSTRTPSSDAVDTASEGLEVLVGGRRMAGVISHVPEITERLTDRIEIVRNGTVSTVLDPRRAAVGQAGAGAP